MNKKFVIIIIKILLKEWNYLISKYRLDKENTFYVGDRSIDMECAKNSGVKGILYLKPDGVGEASGFEDYIVTDLMDITKI